MDFIDDLNKLNKKYSKKLRGLVLQDRFLSEIDRLLEEKGISQKTIAKKLNVSESHISQLFNGKKLLNLEKLAEIQNILEIEFKIQAVNSADIECDDYYVDFNSFEDKDFLPNEKSDTKIVKMPMPTYTDFDIEKSPINNDNIQKTA